MMMVETSAKVFNLKLYQRPFLCINAGANCEAATLSVLVFPGALANTVGRWYNIGELYRMQHA